MKSCRCTVKNNTSKTYIIYPIKLAAPAYSLDIRCPKNSIASEIIERKQAIKGRYQFLKNQISIIAPKAASPENNSKMVRVININFTIPFNGLLENCPLSQS